MVLKGDGYGVLVFGGYGGLRRTSYRIQQYLTVAYLIRALNSAPNKRFEYLNISQCWSKILVVNLILCQKC